MTDEEKTGDRIMAFIQIAQALREAGYECYIVGGAVRDFCLGISPHDIDFATNADPDTVEKLMKKNRIKTTDVGKKYGTIVAYAGKEAFEVTTYRKDIGSADGRHPDSIAYATSIEEDLSRRDFTMNAMAMNPFTKQIIDPFGGRADLKQKKLKFVGNTEDRICEDSLRILRAVRFSVKYGLHLNKRDGMILEENAFQMVRLSKERKTEELKKILTCGEPVSDIFLKYPDILFAVIPDLLYTKDCSQKNKYHKHDVYEHSLTVTDACKVPEELKERAFEIKLAALLHDIGKPHCKTTEEDGSEHFHGHPVLSKDIACQLMKEDLALSNKEKDFVLALIENHDVNYFQTEKQLKKAISKFGEEFLRCLMVLQAADLSDHIIPADMSEAKKRQWFTEKEEIEAMFASIKEQELAFSVKDLALNGTDLLKMGVQQGPDIGKLLEECLDAVIEGRIDNTKEDLRIFVDTFLEQEEERE